MSAQDPASFTVNQLREKLRELNLPMAGNKSELLKRLYEADPTGDWAGKMPETLGPSATSREDRDESDIEAGASAAHRREVDMYRRERELAERELQIMRREIELLRETQQLNVTNRGVIEGESASCTVAKASISAIADLLSPFDGSIGNYENWEKQLKLLKKTYRLSDDYVKILIGMRLKGKASEWFQSKAEYIELSVDDLLVELSEMYDHRPSKVKLRKQFEARVWKSNETFHQYVHEKIILANQVPIPEDEIVEYLIDGIPETSFRDQARIRQISTKASLLKAFEKLSLKDKTSSVGDAERRRQGGREHGKKYSVRAIEFRLWQSKFSVPWEPDENSVVATEKFFWKISVTETNVLGYLNRILMLLLIRVSFIATIFQFVISNVLIVEANSLLF